MVCAKKKIGKNKEGIKGKVKTDRRKLQSFRKLAGYDGSKDIEKWIHLECILEIKLAGSPNGWIVGGNDNV